MIRELLQAVGLVGADDPGPFRCYEGKGGCLDIGADLAAAYAYIESSRKNRPRRRATSPAVRRNRGRALRYSVPGYGDSRTARRVA